MKVSQLRSLIKESIKEVLKENEINTIDYKKLKAIYTLASKLKLYESYIVDETIEDMRRLENAVKTNDESVFEELEESQIDTYELQGLAKLNPEQQAKWKGIDIALRELSRIIYKMDLNLIGEKFKKLAVAINNFNAPVMQERVNERANMRAKRLKENAERPVPGLYKLEAHLKFWASEFLKDFASEDEMLIDFPKYDAQFQALDHDSKLYKLYNMLYDACQNEANNYGKQSSSRRQAIARRILTELPKSNV